MNFRKMLIAVLLGLSLSAVADFTTITEVYEVELTNLRLPGVEGGTLAMSECDGCEVKTLRVSTGARYVLNNKGVTLAEFKKAISLITNRKDVIIDVSHHLESNTITAVMVSL